MRKTFFLKRLFLFLLLSLILGGLFVGKGYSATSSFSSLQEEQRRLERQKQEAAKKRQEILKAEKEKKEQAALVQGEIARLDKNIAETTRIINSTNKKIADVSAQISNTQAEIKQKEFELSILKGGLSQLIISEYTKDTNAFVKTFFSGNDISEIFEELKNSQAFQNEFQRLTDKALNLKTELEEKKAKLEADLQNLTNLKRQNEIARQGLQNQQQIKQQILANTQEEIEKLKQEEAELARIESEIQRKVEEVIAEQIRLAKEAAKRGESFTFLPGPGAGQLVKRGQIIGYVGSTGFSTGPHLHFEVRNSEGVAINPGFLIAGDVPIEEGLYVISQGFGKTDFSWHYASGVHTGIDLAAPIGTPIKAVLDGVVIFRQYYGGYGNAVLVFHADRNLYTLYGHMVSL